MNPMRPSMNPELDPPQDGSGWESELFGAQIVADAGVVVGMSFFDFYKGFCKITLNILDISPMIVELYHRSFLDLD